MIHLKHIIKTSIGIVRGFQRENDFGCETIKIQENLQKGKKLERNMFKMGRI